MILEVPLRVTRYVSVKNAVTQFLPRGITHMETRVVHHHEEEASMRRRSTRLTTTAAAVALALSTWAAPAVAATGGNPGPCDADTPLGVEEARLGWDVTFVDGDEASVG